MSSGIVNSVEAKSGIVGNRLDRNTPEIIYESADHVLAARSRTSHTYYASTVKTLPTPNGLYWIDPGVTNSRPVRVYCDFTSVADGSSQAGGYMLVGKLGTNASRWDWEDSEFVREYTDDVTYVMSALREWQPFTYLRIAWNGGTGSSAPIYNYGSTTGGLVNVGSTSKSRVGSGTGSTGILTVTSFGGAGSYSASTLYHKRQGNTDRNHWYTNYNDNSGNSDGFFGIKGANLNEGYAGSTLASGNASSTGIAWAEFWIR